MSHIEIPLSATESMEVRVLPPDEEYIKCRVPGCGTLIPRAAAWRVRGIVHDRMSDAVLRIEEAYACSERCARAIYHVERIP